MGWISRNVVKIDLLHTISRRRDSGSWDDLRHIETRQWLRYVWYLYVLTPGPAQCTVSTWQWKAWSYVDGLNFQEQPQPQVASTWCRFEHLDLTFWKAVPSLSYAWELPCSSFQFLPFCMAEKDATARLRRAVKGFFVTFTLVGFVWRWPQRITSSLSSASFKEQICEILTPPRFGTRL